MTSYMRSLSDLMMLRGTFKTFARGSQWQFAKIPSTIDYAVAAAVPVGAGGVGQAAIQLTKAVGAEVFVTVGSIEKRDFVDEHYGIPLQHVLSSRDLNFVHGIKRLTDGRGTLRAGWDCIAPYGRSIEIGKVDIFANAGLPRDRSRRALPFPSSTLVSYHLKEVNWSPMGKLVLKAQHDGLVMVEPSRKPTYYFDLEASYLLSGGLGSLGRSAAHCMASRGAKNPILLSRSGTTRHAAQELMKELAVAVVTASAPQCDGCIQGSMILKDSIFSIMSQEDYYIAVRPKVVASQNLHELLPQNLDFFILLSSTSGMIGNRGQSNYCVDNAYQDSLASHRVALRLPGVAVDLGMILSVGFAAENQESMANLHEFLALLDMLCDPNGKYSTNADRELQAPSFAQIAVGLEAPATLRIKGIPEPAWMTDPLFKH
ncbi:KR domain-containing protein [Fusarium sp. MPI-SDFR-AT-0072]|nr:KR domain-containing protein [Fusarium sp. MPI-SDFR-AT-0072]